MARGKRRSAAEMIAEQNAKLAALKRKAAIEEAKSNPALAPLLIALEDVGNRLTAAKRGFSKGPQSFEERERTHRVWLDEILAERDYAAAVQGRLETMRNALEVHLAKVADRLARGENVSVDALRKYADEATSLADDASLVTLESNYNIAKRNRENWILEKAARRAGKTLEEVLSKEENEEEENANAA